MSKNEIIAATASHYVDVTLKLPAIMHVRTCEGESLEVDWRKVPQDIIGQILFAASQVQLNNTFNGGGKDRPEVERKAAVQKKIDAWYRGEVNITSRGDSQMRQMREQFIAERMAEGMTIAAAEVLMAKTCEKVFGKASASFDRFMDAVATQKAKASGEALHDVRTEIEAKLWARTQEALAARAKATEAVDLADLF